MSCGHACPALCHGASPCDASQCVEKVVSKCPCGLRKETRDRCGGVAAVSVACDDHCEDKRLRSERNAKFAAALNINEALPR